VGRRTRTVAGSLYVAGGSAAAKISSRSSIHVTQQLTTGDGILTIIVRRDHIGPAFTARLNIIARYVERMLSTSKE
jgi:hypothetical protein